MRISIKSIPQSIADQYHLLHLVHNGFTLVEISRGMYGLPQAGILAYKQLITHLATHGYTPCTYIPGMWTHATHGVTFCLMVDDFGIKYINRCDADHLLTVLQHLYNVTTDWTGSLYLAMHMAWDYINHTVDISMPGYVAKALDCFQQYALGRPQHSPHAWQKPQYGAHPQPTQAHDDSSILAQPSLTRIHQIVGTVILFYGRAIDSTMLVGSDWHTTIASNQTKGTHKSNRSSSHTTLKLCLRTPRRHSPLSIQKATCPSTYTATCASYLVSEANAARSRAGGTSFVSTKTPSIPPNLPAQTILHPHTIQWRHPHHPCQRHVQR
jgi:hypothetical protein